MIEDNNKKENNIDIKEIIAPYIRYWYIYIICISVAVLSVKIYSRYIIPEYNTFATILIKNTDNNRYPSGALSSLSDVNGLRSEGIDNELLILRSKKLLENVVNNLELHTTITKKGKILTTEIYHSLPISINIQIADSSSTFSEDFIFSYDNNNIFIQNDLNGEKKKYPYNSPVKFSFGSVYFSKIKNNINGENDLNINISDAKTVTNRLKESINANRYQDYKSAIIISMSSPQKEKAKDIINNLIEVFNQDAIDDKNIENKKTAEFINDRIKIINDELGGVEDDISTFKENISFNDPLNTVGLEGIAEIKGIGKEILELNTKEEFLNIYKSQIAKSNINEILPSNLISQNNELSSYISQYNKIVIENNIQKQSATNLNPIIKNREEQLSQLKESILNSIQREVSLIQNQKRVLNDKLNKYKSSYKKIPDQERILKSISRQQTIKENLYLLLLQKREENAIALATSSNKAKIIDSPESIGPTNTNVNTYYLFAILIGFLVPISIIYLIDLLNTKINTRKELSKIIGEYPILGELPSLSKEEANDVVGNDLSPLSEAFRIIRTNLQFMLGNLDSSKGKSILVTSTIKGEGKTFASINIAHILSQLNDKKTIIIGADIRNPQLQRYFDNSRKKIGLTEYLYDNTVKIDDIIIKSSFDNETSMILSGAIPPNPTELIMSNRLNELISELKKHFDFIVIDSAPLLLVSDTYHISGLVDLSVIVARAGFTEKQLIDFPIKAVKDGKLKHPAFILNDVSSRGSGYGYKYGYNYGYGYGYHHKKKKKNLLKNFITKLLNNE